MRWSSRLAWLWLALLPSAISAGHAQIIGDGTGSVYATKASGGGGGYTGPGDVATFTFWGGLRAYSAAVATAGTQAAVNVRRASDSHTCDILVNASGLLGNTANCSTGGDNAQAVASFIAATTGLVVTVYDQTGSGVSCTQATTSKQPQLLLSGGPFTGITHNSLVFTAASGQFFTCSNHAYPLPSTIYSWGNPASATGNKGAVSVTTVSLSNSVYRLTDITGGLHMTFGGVADYNFTTLTFTNAVWSLMGVTISGNSGTAVGYLQNVGGSQGTQSITVGISSGTPGFIYLGFSGQSTEFWDGSMEEWGVAGSVLTSGNMANIYANH